MQVAVSGFFPGAKAKFESSDGPVENCLVPGHIKLVSHCVQLF